MMHKYLTVKERNGEGNVDGEILSYFISGNITQHNYCLKLKKNPGTELQYSTLNCKYNHEENYYKEE